MTTLINTIVNSIDFNKIYKSIALIEATASILEAKDLSLEIDISKTTVGHFAYEFYIIYTLSGIECYTFVPGEEQYLSIAKNSGEVYSAFLEGIEKSMELH